MSKVSKTRKQAVSVDIVANNIDILPIRSSSSGHQLFLGGKSLTLKTK